MSEPSERKRVYWTTRIAVRPSVRDTIRDMAREEMVSMANLIGTALADYVTARSTV
jgi:hypothetical protein